MAFLFEQPKSAFWWVSYRDPETGQRRRESTGFRRDRHNDTRRARAREAELTLAERQVPAAARQRDGWDHWVPTYLDDRYQGQAQSRIRYTTIWRNLRVFLREHQLCAPSQIRREHGFQFFTWRQQRHPGLRPAAHNTALLELKILSMICSEAAERGFIPRNPIAKLGLEKKRPKEKPALEHAHFALLEAAIAADTSPYRTLIERAYLIARWQGCRINETWLNPQTDVTLWEEGGTVRGKIVLRTKGNRLRAPSLAPQLIPLFQRLKAEGATETYARPMNGYQPRTSGIFQDFLLRHGLKKAIPGITHHCLRVSAATAMARAGIRKDKAMEFLGHDNEAVHQAYVRFKPDDFDECFAALSAAGSKPAPASR